MKAKHITITAFIVLIIISFSDPLRTDITTYNIATNNVCDNITTTGKSDRKPKFITHFVCFVQVLS